MAHTARKFAESESSRILRVPEVPEGTIRWRTRGAIVDVDVVVVNTGDRRTDPGLLNVEAAPLGAFVPGLLAARVPVAALDPGERRNVGFVLTRTALPDPVALAGPVTMLLTGRIDARGLELLRSADWAGNLNVWFDVAPERSVEVHRALGLKVGARRTAAVGVDLPEETTGFQIATSCPVPWRAAVERLAGRVCLLGVTAPAAGSRATVVVRVTRRSDRRTVPVEFCFESVVGAGG
jgi:hypothetical protein